MTKKQYIDFFDKNNINGFRGAKVLVGLTYENELIHAFTFGHAFFGKGKYEWELIRGASKLGYQVVGGSSLLWNMFLKRFNPKSCVYYIDFNYFNGNSIKSLDGFKFEGYGSYGIWNWWVKEGAVKNREPSRHKEIKMLEGKDEVIPIYNAGTKIYLFKND